MHIYVGFLGPSLDRNAPSLSRQVPSAQGFDTGVFVLAIRPLHTDIHWPDAPTPNYHISIFAPLPRQLEGHLRNTSEQQSQRYLVDGPAGLSVGA